MRAPGRRGHRRRALALHGRRRDARLDVRVQVVLLVGWLRGGRHHATERSRRAAPVRRRRAPRFLPRGNIGGVRPRRHRQPRAPCALASAVIPSYPLLSEPTKRPRDEVTGSISPTVDFFPAPHRGPVVRFFSASVICPARRGRVLHTVHPSSFISSHRVARRTARRPAPLGLIPEKKQKRNRNGNVRVSSPSPSAPAQVFSPPHHRAREPRTEVRSPARPIRNSSSSKSSSGNRSKRSVTGRSPSSRNAPRMRSNGAASTNHLRRISPFVA